jgi:hypothetical protein
MLLENVNGINGISMDGAMEIIRDISAFADQIIVELGGIRNVELLLVIGSIIGFLACIYQIKRFER